ncbi:MAG: hypothetical protein WDO71_25885 [Bacteroidota bacterium]
MIPRAYKTFIIPGDFGNAAFNSYPSWDNTAKTTTANLTDGTPANTVVKAIDAKFTYNAKRCR